MGQYINTSSVDEKKKKKEEKKIVTKSTRSSKLHPTGPNGIPQGSPGGAVPAPPTRGDNKTQANTGERKVLTEVHAGNCQAGQGYGRGGEGRWQRERWGQVGST